MGVTFDQWVEQVKSELQAEADLLRKQGRPYAADAMERALRELNTADRLREEGR